MSGFEGIKVCTSKWVPKDRAYLIGLDALVVKASAPSKRRLRWPLQRPWGYVKHEFRIVWRRPMFYRRPLWRGFLPPKRKTSSLGAFDAALKAEYAAVMRDMVNQSNTLLWGWNDPNPLHGPFRYQLIPVRSYLDTDAGLPGWYTGQQGFELAGSCLVDLHEHCERDEW
jgi:hypothetical protein